MKYLLGDSKFSPDLYSYLINDSGYNHCRKEELYLNEGQSNHAPVLYNINDSRLGRVSY